MNFERILLLLSVLEKAAGYPNLKIISDLAAAELNGMVTPMKPYVPTTPITVAPIFPKDSGTIETHHDERRI